MVGTETAELFPHAGLVETRFQYDTRRYPFAELFKARLDKHLASDGRAVPALERIHERFDAESLSELYDLLYALEDEPQFRALYGQYIEECVAPLFGEPVRYQRKPGIRIHLPGTMTVQYHTDEWYGHGPEVLNFWTPLTAATGTNSLYVASLEDSIAETRRLEEEKAPMEEINRRLARITRPLEVRYGETFIFSTRVVHGTEMNETSQTRVSIDYRVMPSGGDPGMKNVHDYYVSTDHGEGGDRRESAVSRRSAGVYIFPQHGFVRQIDSNHQRVIVTEVARQHGLAIVAEETEIRTMAHHPQLLRMAAGRGTHVFDAVVLFSVLCLPADRGDRERIYETARRANVELIFALERVAFPADAGEEAVEALRGKQAGAM